MNVIIYMTVTIEKTLLLYVRLRKHAPGRNMSRTQTDWLLLVSDSHSLPLTRVILISRVPNVDSGMPKMQTRHRTKCRLLYCYKLKILTQEPSRYFSISRETQNVCKRLQVIKRKNWLKINIFAASIIHTL